MTVTVEGFFADETIQNLLRVHYQTLRSTTASNDQGTFAQAVVNGALTLNKLGLADERTIAFLANTEIAKQIETRFSVPTRAAETVKLHLQEEIEATNGEYEVSAPLRGFLWWQRTSLAQIQTGAERAWRAAPLGSILLASAVLAYYIETSPAPADPSIDLPEKPSAEEVAGWYDHARETYQWGFDTLLDSQIVQMVLESQRTAAGGRGGRVV